MAECVKETLFLRQVLEFVRPDLSSKATVVYQDNEGAVQLANNPLGSNVRSISTYDTIFYETRSGKGKSMYDMYCLMINMPIF